MGTESNYEQGNAVDQEVKRGRFPCFHPVDPLQKRFQPMGPKSAQKNARKTQNAGKLDKPAHGAVEKFASKKDVRMVQTEGYSNSIVKVLARARSVTFLCHAQGKNEQLGIVGTLYAKFALVMKKKLCLIGQTLILIPPNRFYAGVASG